MLTGDLPLEAAEPYLKKYSTVNDIKLKKKKSMKESSWVERGPPQWDGHNGIYPLGYSTEFTGETLQVFHPRARLSLKTLLDPSVSNHQAQSPWKPGFMSFTTCRSASNITLSLFILINKV